jgi:hypothetical protein
MEEIADKGTESSEDDIGFFAVSRLSSGISSAETVHSMRPTARETHASAIRLFLLPRNLNFMEFFLSSNAGRPALPQSVFRFTSTYSIEGPQL